jgi:hypothetical protein
MPGGLAPYLVAVFAMSFSGLSALTLFHVARHLDPPEAPGSPTHLDK